MKGVARSTTAPTGAARWWLTGHAVLVFVFFYAPIAVLVAYSFDDSRIIGGWDGLTLRWYRDFADNQTVIDALMVSIKVAIVSTIISVVLGTLSALSIERFRWRGRRVFDAILYLPIIIPDVTMAVMLLAFFSEATDLLDRLPFIDLRSGLETLVISHVAFNISFVSVVVRARLANLDPSMEEAAADLYANRWQSFRRVTLPQIMPGIVGGALLAITLSLDDVVVSSFVQSIGSTPLPVYVFGLIRRGVTPLINAVSVVMLTASILLILLSLFGTARHIINHRHEGAHPMTRSRALAVLLAAALFVVACGDDDSGGDAAAPDGGGGDATTCAVDQTDGDLALYNWSEYIDPDLISSFEDQYSVSVTEDFYPSNEEMLARIQGGATFDVIVPSDYMVSVMIDEGLLMPIQKDAVPNLSNLADRFAADLPYDPKGEYSVPYQWGTTGLGVDLAVVGEDVPHTWGLIFDPELSAQYAGKITMLDDPRESLGAALKYLGYSLNTTDKSQLDEAEKLLADAIPRLAAFDSDQYDELLIQGESAIAHGYSGNFFTAFDEGDSDLRVLRPRRGRHGVGRQHGRPEGCAAPVHGPHVRQLPAGRRERRGADELELLRQPEQGGRGVHRPRDPERPGHLPR